MALQLVEQRFSVEIKKSDMLMLSMVTTARRRFRKRANGRRAQLY